MGLKIFMSYATKDAELFNVPEIAKKLEKKQGIEKVLYWQKHLKENIREYMNTNIEECDIFILFCSPEAKKSTQVKQEWNAADQIGKHIIPIFTKKEHIPAILSSKLGVEFDIFNKEGVSDGIYEIIMKKFPEITINNEITKVKRIESENRIDLNREYQYYMKVGQSCLDKKKFNEALENFKSAKKKSQQLFDAELTIQVNEYIYEVEKLIHNPTIQEYSIEELEELENSENQDYINDEEFIKEDKKENEDERIEEEGPYQVLYVRISKIRDLLVVGETKLRLSGEARNILAYYLDLKVHEGVRDIINKLPRVSKGNRKDQLKRITIYQDEFDIKDEQIIKNYQSKYIRVSKIRALLREGNVLIRIARNAWNLLICYLDNKIIESINLIINNMPRKIKGENVGELKRITIQIDDFDTILEKI